MGTEGACAGRPGGERECSRHGPGNLSVQLACGRFVYTRPDAAGCYLPRVLLPVCDPAECASPGSEGVGAVSRGVVVVRGSELIKRDGGDADKARHTQGSLLLNFQH